MRRFALLWAMFALVACNGPASPSEPAAAQDSPAVAAAPAPSADCTVEVEGPSSAVVGTRTKATVTLRPRGRFEVNQDAPLSVRVSSDSLSLDKERYTVDDATVLAPDEVAMEIPFSAATPGRHTLEVHAHFGLCGGDACALCRKTAELTTVVD